MTSPTKLEQVELWCRVQITKSKWWNFWDKGYIAACKDILDLIEVEGVVLVPLGEYKAIEGHYEDNGWSYP